MVILFLGVACIVDAPSGDSHTKHAPSSDTSEQDTSGAETAATDSDGDGFSETEDCNDADATVNPDAIERCNGKDDDCDGVIDEDDAIDALEWYPDVDDDGWGGELVRSCEPPASAVDRPGDCDDAAPGVNPDGTERCDGVDEDCDGVVDDACATAPTGTLALADAQMFLWGEDPMCQFGHGPFAHDQDADGRPELAADAWCDDSDAVVSRPGPFVADTTFSRAADSLLWDKLTGDVGQAVYSAGDAGGGPETDLLVVALVHSTGAWEFGLYIDPAMGSTYLDADLRVAWELPGRTEEESLRSAYATLIPGADGPAVVVSASWWSGSEVTDDDVWIVDGTARGETSQMEWPLLGPEGHMGWYGSQHYPRDVGDLDGDGNHELALLGNKRFHVYYGPLVGSEAREPDVRLSEIDGEVSSLITNYGDLDGDGRDDLLPAVYAGDDEGTRLARVVWDGGTLTPLTNSLFVIGDNQYVSAIADPADIDGDGFLDLALANDSEDGDFPNMGVVWVAYGPFDGVRQAGEAGDAVIWGGGQEGLGQGLATGDFNGDDYADLVVGNGLGSRDDHPGVLGLFFGGPRP